MLREEEEEEEEGVGRVLTFKGTGQDHTAGQGTVCHEHRGDAPCQMPKGWDQVCLNDNTYLSWKLDQ